MKWDEYLRGFLWIIFIVVLISVIYGPFILVGIYGDNMSFQVASTFLNNLVGISALVLSIVAMWVTINGMDWQKNLEIKITQIVDTVGRIESRGIIEGKSVKRQTVKVKNLAYKDEKKA